MFTKTLSVCFNSYCGSFTYGRLECLFDLRSEYQRVFTPVNPFRPLTSKLVHTQSGTTSFIYKTGSSRPDLPSLGSRDFPVVTVSVCRVRQTTVNWWGTH